MLPTQLYKDLSASCVSAEALDQFLCLAVRTLSSSNREEGIFVVNTTMAKTEGSHWFTVYLRKSR